MDFHRFVKFDKGIVIKDVRNFELPHIFDCGQCFRWNIQENGNYIGVAYGKVIEIEKKGEDVLIYNASEDDFTNIWAEYFDLYRDYASIKKGLQKDELLLEAVQFGKGIRILRQEPFETTISFIISANNRIPMIKRAIHNISKKWGKCVEYKGELYYTFPDINALSKASIEELENCGTGFRAKYIFDTAQKLMNDKEYKGIYTLNYIKELEDDWCHLELQKFSGIGPKVADCIMLFSMQKYSAFPVDVWVKRAMQHLYLAPDVSLRKIRQFARDKFGLQAGFAQQYLFYYARENNIIP